MNHIYNLANIQLLQPTVLTIGVFDGVHTGHQHLISKLVTEAHTTNRLAVVMTFFPHPDVVLRGIEGRFYLTSPDERAEYLLQLGVDYVITHPFNDDVRHIRAADFVDLLVQHLQIDALWVGEDFALGYKREGNVDFLTQQGKLKGFSVQTIDTVNFDDDGKVSSTLIRQAVQEGNVTLAKELLGRSYSVAGEVVHGQKRGRTIGFPTANIAAWEYQVIPANGIYAGWAYLGSERYMAMTNIGISPTFEYKGVTVESYLLDFNREIYGQNLKVTFEKYMRPEVKYTGVDALIAQINEDVRQGREYLRQLEGE